MCHLQYGKQKFYTIIVFIIIKIKYMRSNSEQRIKYLEKLGFKSEVQKLRKDYNNTNRFREIKHHQKSKSLKNLDRNHLNKQSGNFLDPTKIISVSASKWVIYDYYSQRYVRGYRSHDEHELSVFSKLLVFCTINTLIAKHKLDVARFQTIVTPTILRFYKNSKLKVDDIVTLDHLIHLLLMDEGEQFQLIIALNIGAYLEKKRKKQYYSVYDADQKMYKIHVGQFYELVNSYCQTMKLQNITYVQADPNKKRLLNKCSASDIAILSAQCLKIPLFQQILKLSHKTVQIKYIDGQGLLKTRRLQLRNKTVNNQFISYFNVCRNWEQNQFMNSNASVFYQQAGIQPVIVVLLSSYGPKDREKDIQQIIQWYIKTSTNNPQKQKKKLIVKTEGSDDSEKQIQKKPFNRLSTQMSRQLQTILQQKLKGNQKQQKQRFLIKPVKKSAVRLLTQN